MKYQIITIVNAVLLVDKDAESIAALAEMLPNVPHFYTDDGLIFPGGGEIDDEVIEYGKYIIKEAHGLSVMTKEMFEGIATLVEEEEEAQS